MKPLKIRHAEPCRALIGEARTGESGSPEWRIRVRGLVTDDATAWEYFQDGQEPRIRQVMQRGFDTIPDGPVTGACPKHGRVAVDTEDVRRALRWGDPEVLLPKR